MMKAVFFILLFLAFGMFVLNKNNTVQNNRQIASSSGSLTCNEYFSQIRSRKPKTVQEALNIIREIRPEFLSNYTFGYESRAVHGSSFEYPRALVYGDDAKMVVSFNGEQNQMAYERLEVMCFNERHNTFEFVDIAFPGEAKSEDELYDIPENLRNEPFVISPVNGHPERRCTMCHQEPARPNWDTYNLWPGFCDSQLFAGEHFDSREEDQKCDQFFNGNMKKGRYSVLSLENYDDRTNEHLGNLLAPLNRKRIFSELERKGTAFKSIRYQIAEALMCNPLVAYNPEDHGYPKDFIPPLFSASGGFNSDGIDISHLAPQPFPPLARKYLQANMENYAERLKRTTQNFNEQATNQIGHGMYRSIYDRRGAEFLAKYYGVTPKNNFERAGLLDASRVIEETLFMAKLTPLMEGLGVDISNWSMSIIHGGYGHESNMHWGPFIQEYAEKFLPEEKELIAVGMVVPYDQTPEGKAALKKKCDIVHPKAEAERAKGHVVPVPPNQLNGTGTEN
ncbi:MAG: hypothetical protein KDD33_03515 [Bdellovibrionales bacterium]|nr:hypothetical protein [Bdellovibrionales bacterium]